MTEPLDDEFVEPNANHEAEVETLTACFQSKTMRTKVRGIATSADFYWPHHQNIWDAMERLDKHDKAVSAPSLIELVKRDRLAIAVLPDLARAITDQVQAVTAAEIVHNLATRRRTITELTIAMQQARNPAVNAEGFVAGLVTRFTELRDVGESTTHHVPITVTELIAADDEPYDWVIPGLLERGDRFMLTGEEGLGKSVLLRQVAMSLAAGVHPFSNEHIRPGRSLVIDAENSTKQNRRRFRELDILMAGKGERNASDHTHIEMTGRIDITKDLVLSRVHRMIDDTEPDLLVIGPLYRLAAGAIQTDDEAGTVLAALDTIKDRGVAMLIEAHAGHQRQTGTMRPRGSSAFLGWPEFGYGLRASTSIQGVVDVERWRGDRDERHWPHSLERGRDMPWVASEQQRIEWASEVDRQRALQRDAINATARQHNPFEDGYQP